MKRAFEKQNVASVVLVTLILFPILMITRISAIPWEFAYLEIGRLIGPILGLILLILILLVPIIMLIRYLDANTNIQARELLTIIKKEKNCLYYWSQSRYGLQCYTLIFISLYADRITSWQEN